MINNNNNHTQYYIIRHFRSTHGKYVWASPHPNFNSLSMGDLNGNYSRFLPYECRLLFFKRGLRKEWVRIGGPTLDYLHN